MIDAMIIKGLLIMGNNQLKAHKIIVSHKKLIRNVAICNHSGTFVFLRIIIEFSISSQTSNSKTCYHQQL